jgi:predicted transcriptional regulator
MNQKRRTNDIIASEILKLCMNGASKTRIIHKANLNFLSAKSHIENLMNNGLMEAVPTGSKVIYRTTPKGAELSRVFGQFHNEMDKLFSYA